MLTLGKLVGMKESKAIQILAESEMLVHIAQRDSELYERTKKFQSNRVSLTVKSGVVVSAEIG